MKKITLIYASMTGNAQFVADNAKSALEDAGHTVNEFCLDDNEEIASDYAKNIYEYTYLHVVPHV